MDSVHTVGELIEAIRRGAERTYTDEHRRSQALRSVTAQLDSVTVARNGDDHALIQTFMDGLNKG